MVNKTTSTIPFWSALTIYWLLTGALLLLSLDNTQGRVIYPLDDTYIHMAMAKNFVKDGVWGIDKNSFSSSTSSPLWTLLIAITYKIFGINIWSPLLLSVMSGSLIMYCCYRLLANNTNSLRLFLLLLVITAFVPLPVLTLTGMEHLLHGFLVLLLIYLVSVYLSENVFRINSYILLVILANLTTITRYESVLLVFLITFLFLSRNRFREGLFFAVSSFVLVTIYGCISLANGWYFLPNSVLLKGNTLQFTLEGISAFLWRTINHFYFSPHVVVLLIACLILYLWFKYQLKEGEKILIVLSVLVTFTHMMFAGVGWFFRYEAYIVLILMVIFIDVLNKYLDLQHINKWNLYDCGAIIFLIFLFLMPLAMRTGLSFSQYPRAVTNIYEQQYQMGLFLQKYYQGQCVAANDIGAINYLADICTVDLYGLANMEIAKYKFSNSYDKHAMRRTVLDNDVKVIIIYNDWFNENIPSDWIEVGRWKILNNVVTGGDEISFYAPDVSSAKRLRNNLIDFSGTLPSTIIQSGSYLSP